jgi:DNA-binding MarR family transcriptional regulator
MQKQPPPALEPTDCNCLALRQAARHVSQVYERYLAAEGLKSTQYSILSKLNRLGPQSINELAKSMVMDRTTLGRAVRPLERDRLLTIEAGEDARIRRLKITAAGQVKVKSAAARWREAQKEFEQAYGVAESAELRSALGRVVNTI